MTALPSSNNPDDILFNGTDTEQRYLGHSKAVYGFILDGGAAPRNFVFPLNPQSIEQDEEAAITITPTQGGGKFIENQGNIFKDISISGTTGFLPTRNFKGVAGPTLFQQASALLEGGPNPAAAAYAMASGYNKFLELRSLFREYWAIHRNGNQEERSRTQLFWFNGKDNETWLVEPMSFRMSRTSRSPMTYNYAIRLRTIAIGAGKTIPPDPASVASPFAAAKTALRGVQDRIATANKLLNDSLSFFSAYRGLQTQLLSILDTGTMLGAQITKIARGTADVLDLPKSLLRSATANILNVFQGVQDAADLSAAVPVDTLDGLTLMRQQMDFVLAKEALFKQKWANRWNAATKNFNTEYGINGNAAEDVQAGLNRSAIIEATPTSGETLQQFAQRITGDPGRAGEIALLNDLKWPYFSPSRDERAPGTVAPGDPVLVPVDLSTNSNDNAVGTSAKTNPRTYSDEVVSSSGTNIVKFGLDQWRPNQWVGYTVQVGEQERLITANDAFSLSFVTPLNPIPTGGELFKIFFKSVLLPARAGIEELLGVDILIRRNPLTEKWDFVRASGGGVALVRGQENLNQALNIKCITTQKELICHSWFGLKPVFGERGTPEALLRLRLFFEQTLLSDTRIESIESLVVKQVRDQYQTEAKLAVKGGLRSQFASPLV